MFEWDWAEIYLGFFVAFRDGLISISAHFFHIVNLTTISIELKRFANLEKLRLGTSSGYKNCIPVNTLKFHELMLNLKLLALRDCCTFREFISLVSTKHVSGVTDLDVVFTDTMITQNGGDMDRFANINKYLSVLKYVKMAESRAATYLMLDERKKERKGLFEKLVTHFWT